MKMLIIALLTMSSASCVRNVITTRCNVSFQFDRCRCYQYDLLNTNRLSDPIDYPLEDCEGIVGFYDTEWAEKITPAIKDLRRRYIKRKK